MSDQPPDRSLPRVYYGEVDESEDDNDELPEYEGMQDDDDDDAPASPELIDWLGFDPDKLDEDEDTAEDQAEEEEDQAEEEDEQEQGLIPKAEVQYEHPASGDEHCADCVSFRSPNGCALVESPIQPEDWCNLFEGEDEPITVDTVNDQDFPMPLDPDLAALAQGKQYNIVQSIYAIQASRNRSRPHAADAEWKEEQHKRGGNQENPGQFSAGSGGGSKAKTETDKPSPSPSPETKASGSTKLPKTPADITSSKVSLGEVYRGTGSGQDPANLRSSLGDLGKGVYLTPSRPIAESYGGGPEASISKGTRQVHAYTMPELFPEEVVFVFGGKKIGSPVTLVDGNGLKIWEGDWKGENIERALANEPDIKAVVGTPDSIGLNQIAIRDPSILSRPDKASESDKPSPAPSSKDKEFNDKLAKFGFRDLSGRDDIVGQAYYTNAKGDMITVEKAAGGALEWYIISTDQDKAVNGVGIESLSAALRKQNYAELGNRVDSKIVNGLERKGYHQTHEDEYGTVYLFQKENQTRISLKMDGNDLKWWTVSQDETKNSNGKGLESLEKQIGNLDTEAKSTKIKALQDKALAVVVKSGYNPKMVSFSDEDKTFNLNGASFKYAGAAYIEGDRAGDIVFYNSQLKDETIGRIAAHETMHQKFQMVLNEYKDEQTRMHDDKRGGDRWVMKPDGELREEYRADYPVYAALEPVFYRGGIWNKLQKEDGVTDYSRSWWEAHAKLTANFMQAAHETMAEMAANEWYNKNELIKTPGEKKPRSAHPNWQRVFKEVNQLYKTRADRAKNDPHQEAA